jgi:ABC-type nitrate/sulfonate/bicarbonate transport system substrate-binding protein
MREDLARNDKDTAVKIVKSLVETSDWMNANGREAARVANEVLRAPSEEDAEKQLSIFKWPADFKKAEKELELKIAEWGISIGLFPAKDARALVDGLIYPDLIRAAAPDRTDM